ncbi:MAG: hypothetical protein WBD20_21280, partial [Pirellulaceae bacterium]
STLTAYTGQTVVFGGLIQKSRSNISRRVPVMADIPLIGNLFKYDTEQETRNELLVIMTPMLINGEQDLDYVKEAESRRMSWCLADVVEAHGDVGLNGGYGLWGPAVGNTIYPDVHPTVQNEVVVSDVPLNGGSQIINDPTGQYRSQPASQPIGQPVYQAPQQTFDSATSGIGNEPPVTIEPFQGEISSELIESAVQDALPAPAPGLGDGAAMNRSAFPPAGSDQQFGAVQQSGFANVADTASNAAANPNRTVGWWQNEVKTPSKATPVRLGATTNDKNSILPTPKWQSSKTDAPASETSSSTLLPAISPRSWIR